MYGLGISEKCIESWEKEWSLLSNRLSGHDIDYKTSLLIFAKTLTVDTFNINLFLIWYPGMDEPKLVIIPDDDGYEKLDPIFKNPDKLVVYNRNTGGYSRNRVLSKSGGVGFSVPKKNILHGTDLELKWFIDFHIFGYDQFFDVDSILQNRIDMHSIQTLNRYKAQFKKHIKRIDYCNLRNKRYINNTRTTGSCEIINWYCELLLDKPIDDVFPRLAGVLKDPVKGTELKDKLSEHSYLAEILDVYELNNGIRICAIFRQETPSVTDTAIVAIHPNDTSWQYMDVNRKIYYDGSYRQTMGDHPKLGLGEGAKVFIDEVTKFLPTTATPFKLFVKRERMDAPRLLTTEEIKRLNKLAFNKDLKDQTAKKNANKKNEKIVKRLQVLLKEHGQTLTINDVTYDSEKIIYQEQTIRCDQISPIHLLNSLMARNHLDAIDFEMYFDAFLQTLEAEFLHKTTKYKVTGIIGVVPFKIEMVPKRDTAGRSSVWAYVNGVRINKTEVSSVIRRALCLNDVPSYIAFLQSVTSCSLKIHSILHYGIAATAQDEFLQISLKLKFKIDRDKNRHYLTIADKTYPIHDINGLAAIKDCRNMNAILSILENKKIIELEEKEIVSAIEISKKDYADAIEKSKKLLEKVCKMVGTELEGRVINGGTIQGYFIRGKARDYFLEHSREAKVYDVNRNYHPLCIVEKTGSGADPDDQVGVDKLVNRLLMAKNDSLVAQYVHTLLQ